MAGPLTLWPRNTLCSWWVSVLRGRVSFHIQQRGQSLFHHETLGRYQTGQAKKSTRASHKLPSFIGVLGMETRRWRMLMCPRVSSKRLSVAAASFSPSTKQTIRKLRTFRYLGVSLGIAHWHRFQKRVCLFWRVLLKPLILGSPPCRHPNGRHSDPLLPSGLQRLRVPEPPDSGFGFDRKKEASEPNKTWTGGSLLLGPLVFNLGAKLVPGRVLRRKKESASLVAVDLASSRCKSLELPLVAGD